MTNNIIALGGGEFLSEKIRSRILKNDCSIWLKWEKNTLISRLTKSFDFICILSYAPL